MIRYQEEGGEESALKVMKLLFFFREKYQKEQERVESAGSRADLQKEKGRRRESVSREQVKNVEAGTIFYSSSAAEPARQSLKDSDRVSRYNTWYQR